MKILLLDLELAPNLATVWSIWNQNIGINQLLDTGRVLCYTAQWYGTRDVIFDSEYDNLHPDMISNLWNLMDEADVIVHYNGDRFDIPVVNREFLLYGLPPPSSYKSVDLYQVIKKRFRFVSNKLDHVCKELELGSKVQHEGHELWLKCMNGDSRAWKRMEKYNRQDVKLLDKLYKRLLPWIPNHPNRNLYNTDNLRVVCPVCGSSHIIRNGIEHLKTRSYQRYRCSDCGAPMRDVKTIPNSTVSITL